MRRSYILVGLILLTLTSVATGQHLANPILLWPEGAPGATGTTDEDKPAIIPFIPEASKRNGAAILVVPGGGFTIRAVDHEGVLVAQWLKDQGITAFLLRYRLRPLYTRADWVRDGQRGMQFIRSPKKIQRSGESSLESGTCRPAFTINASSFANILMITVITTSK